jgi:hypothetical protein
MRRWPFGPLGADSTHTEVTLDKKIAGLLGAAAALGTMSSSQAVPLPAPSEALRANSYADLLAPIPNAGAMLQVLDREQGAAPAEARIQMVSDHHHHFRRPVIVIKPRRHHHHHHHHHHHN